jgi:hypothetical protein
MNLDVDDRRPNQSRFEGDAVKGRRRERRGKLRRNGERACVAHEARCFALAAHFQSADLSAVEMEMGFVAVT